MSKTFRDTQAILHALTADPCLPIFLLESANEGVEDWEIVNDAGLWNALETLCEQGHAVAVEGSGATLYRRSDRLLAAEC